MCSYGSAPSTIADSAESERHSDKAQYTWERVRRRRALPDSGRKWETCWYRETCDLGRKYDPASMQLCGVGLTTSAKAIVIPPIGPSIISKRHMNTGKRPENLVQIPDRAGCGNVRTRLQGTPQVIDVAEVPKCREPLANGLGRGKCGRPSLLISIRCGVMLRHRKSQNGAHHRSRATRCR